MNIDELLEILRKENALLRSTYHVSDIGIFGSSVKGTFKKNSDIDVLVSFDHGRKDLFNSMRLKMCLEQLLDRKVDLVMKEAVKPRLRDRILSEVRYVQ
jgi:predicted nucleotidyltransferase